MEFILLSSATGVEVRGLEPHLAWKSPDLDRLRSALDAHHLLLFRGFEVDQADQVALCEALLGPAEEGLLTNREGGGPGGTGHTAFHSDETYTWEPTEAIGAYGLEIPASGACTAFCKLRASLANDAR